MKHEIWNKKNKEMTDTNDDAQLAMLSMVVICQMRNKLLEVLAFLITVITLIFAS